MNKAEQRALEAYPEQDILRTANHYQAERRKEKRRVFREGYRRAEKDLGWHSVKESLPPMDEEVIVLTDNIHGKTVPDAQYICYGHIVNKNIAVDYDGWNIPGVTHWMHLPKIEIDK